MNHTIGPYSENEDIVLSCRVVGGQPEPTVRWFVNDVLVDADHESNAGTMIVNRLEWKNVTRASLHSVFSCQARNTNLTDPRNASVVLNLNLAPLSIRILTKEEPLSAGKEYNITCESSGSRPPAVLTWYKGHHHKLGHTESAVQANKSVSKLTITPTTDDNGKTLTCRAENPTMTGKPLNFSWKLNVVYPPIVEIRLGSNLRSDDISAGDDVYFECIIRANPPWRKLSWYHNGVVLQHNQSARVITSHQSLVLQGVTRAQAGEYSCVANNGIGESSSNVLRFRVKYRPVCQVTPAAALSMTALVSTASPMSTMLTGSGVSPAIPKTVGAFRGETVELDCSVDADPPAVSYRWKVNSSGETLDLATDRLASRLNGSASILKYTPTTEHDFGTLMCWAENSVGLQQEPCIFNVVSATVPAAVRDCSLRNYSTHSVTVQCTSQFDGGLAQYFVLEATIVAGARAGQLAVRVDSSAPIFNLTDSTDPATNGLPLSIAVFAVNPKGRSVATVAGVVALGDTERQAVAAAELSLTPVVAGGVFLGALCTVILLLLVAARLRRGVKTSRRAVSTGDTNADPPPPTTASLAKSVLLDDEKDPDVIPAKFDPVTTRVIGNGAVPPYPREGINAKGYPGGLDHWSTLPRKSLPVMDTIVRSHEDGAWEIRPKDLRLSSSIGSTHSDPLALSTNVTDLELNGNVIKERLMTHRVPESCV